MTINELALKHNVSYQAIHKHFKELKKEEAYQNSYRKKGHQTELDDDLVKAIEDRMEIPEKIILSNAVNEELEAENKQLAEVNSYQKLIIQLQQEKAMLLEQNSQYLALQASNEDLKQKLEDAESRAFNAEFYSATLQTAAADAQQRASEAQDRASKAEADLSATSNKNIELQTELRLEKERREEAETKLEELKNRSFWDRLFNR